MRGLGQIAKNPYEHLVKNIRLCIKDPGTPCRTLKDSGNAVKKILRKTHMPANFRNGPKDHQNYLTPLQIECKLKVRYITVYITNAYVLYTYTFSIVGWFSRS